MAVAVNKVRSKDHPDVIKFKTLCGEGLNGAVWLANVSKAGI
jgi:hypothetical protein